MRILYSFPIPLGSPGIGTTALQQVRGLLDLGHQITVVTTSVHRNSPRISAPVVTTMTVGDRRIPHRVLGFERTMSFHDQRVATHLRRNPESYDIVHCWPGAVIRTCEAAKEIGIPVVREVPNTHTANAYDVVGALCAELNVELPKGHSHRLDVKKLRREEVEYRVAPFLLVPSEYVFSTFIARGFSPDKLLRHQYGFDDSSFTPPAKVQPGPFHAVFLGAVEPRKGVHVALEAWRRAHAYRDSRLSIYGRVVEGYDPIVSPYRNLPNVNFYGFTDDPPKVFQGAHVLLLPSFEEGSALVTYEAQGCGVIPLVSDATGALCAHEVSGMIHHAGNAGALSQHIERLRTDRPFLEQLRRGVLEHRPQLTWAAAARRLEECYALAQGARPMP